MPVDITVTMYPSLEEGLMFWGMIRPAYKKFEYLVVSSKGIIEGATEKIAGKLRIENQKNATFNSICPKNCLQFNQQKSEGLGDKTDSSSRMIGTEKSIDTVQIDEPTTKIFSYNVYGSG